ncbi:MAG TPA: hypothetical protein VFG21_12160 [Xanthomonadaceae bacterium]|nr:hypothetical protein [Xanthomonadaceae bacterium]
MTPRLHAFTAAGALATALCAGPAAAAVKLSDAFDGNWFNSSESGRGATVDYVGLPDGSGVFFLALFSFDNDGNPYWIITAPHMVEHEFSSSDNIQLYSGGNFGSPFTPPGAPVVGGTSTVTVHSCNRITVELDMNEASGLPDVTLELEQGQRAVGLGSEPMCAYQTEFTGCPSFASAGSLPRSCVLSGNLLDQDVVLTNDTTWLLDGLVRVGGDNANQATVTIEPGTVLAGDGGTADYLYVNPGSKIFANGRPWAPIVFTSINDGFVDNTEAAPGDVGGLVVSGNAPANACPQAPFNCFSEFDQTQRFGGDDPHDSSGEISYFQVRYAGIRFFENAEVNAFTFQGVGDGTTVHHIQAYRGQDDGVEFFGGTVNVKHVVVTEGGDDGIDWDLGWSGKIQYALVADGDGFGEDHGIEAANNPDNDDALPRATPVLSNLTLLGTAGSGDGIRLKEGSAGQIWNTVVGGYPASCINITNGPTYTAAGTPASPTGITAFNGVLIDCATNFKQDGDAPWNTQDFFNSAAFAGNQIAPLQLNGYQPTAGSPARSGGLRVVGEDGFFDFTPYRGAFDGRTDWTEGWTFRPGGDRFTQ